jgi:hypothetical protein
MGGCAVVRVRPIDKPTNSVRPHGAYRLSNPFVHEDADDSDTLPMPEDQQQDIHGPGVEATEDTARPITANQHKGARAITTTKTVRTEMVVTTTSEVRTATTGALGVILAHHWFDARNLIAR